MKDNKRGIQIMRVLKQLKGATRHNMEQHFKGMNITAPQGMLIGILAHEGKMKVGELSDKIGLSISTVSGIIDRLEKQEVVERVRSQEDRRVVYVDLTKEFKKGSKNHFHHMEEMFENIMNKATPEEFDAVINGMNILEKLLKERSNEMDE